MENAAWAQRGESLNQQELEMENFISILAKNDRSLTLYVLSLCPNVNEAEDILQEVKLVLWQKFSHFEEGTSFIAWARKIAFFKVLSYRKNKAKKVKFVDEALLMEISDDGEDRQELWHRRGLTLDQCISQINEQQKELLKMRYKEQLQIDEMATRLGRNPGAVYRQLSRIRQQLLECVQKHLNRD